MSAQADTEKADRRRERDELAADPQGELRELTAIYQERGLPLELASEVAATLHAKDPLGAHLRDELGHTAAGAARPLQAAVASAASFAVGATIPLLATALTSSSIRTAVIAKFTLVALCVLGVVGAALGNAPRVRGALRVGVGGALALALTYGIGALFGTAT